MSDVFSRLQAMKREIHLRELQLLDAVRRRFMHHQQTLKEAELQRLDDEIERKVSTTTGTPANGHQMLGHGLLTSLQMPASSVYFCLFTNYSIYLRRVSNCVKFKRYLFHPMTVLGIA